MINVAKDDAGYHVELLQPHGNKGGLPYLTINC
jgi:hypothetical protein